MRVACSGASTVLQIAPLWVVIFPECKDFETEICFERAGVFPTKFYVSKCVSKYVTKSVSESVLTLFSGVFYSSIFRKTHFAITWPIF